MELWRKEILPGVQLTCLHTDKFKTGFMSATLLTQLTRAGAAENALIPSVLRRGTATAPDMSALQARLDELYGMRVEPVVRKKGEIQCVGFQCSFCDGRFLPERTDMAARGAALLGELWLSPNMRGGLFQPDYVESERDKLVERIEALVNDKMGYARQRLVEEMCSCEDYGVNALGTAESAENIYYIQLTRRYKKLLAGSPMELFYCGGAAPEHMAEAFTAAFLTLPRGEIDEELGTDIRMNTVEERPREFTEELAVEQGQLALGFRLGKAMEEPDYPALLVLNALYGGAINSRLFLHVRERLSLCYYAYSLTELHKGVLLACAGIDFAKEEAARAEMLAQLEDLRAGNITAEELEAAKRELADALRAIGDSPAALESYWFDQILLGELCAPEELAALVEDVTAAQVTAAAQDIRLDAAYFLKGEAHE